MSIPRIAINRPVTMFMLSGVIVLLGAISLLRLPVDLMPELQLPSVTIRVNYPGVGPREMEESITRPLEQAVSAVAGLEQVNATSNEGSSVIRLNFAWGTNLNVAADDVRSRIDRIRARLPEEADAPIVFKFDSTAFPILFLAVEGDFNAVQLRDIAENTLAQRLERVPGVAAVNVNGGLRRQILVELSREKTTAMGLSVDRIISLLTTENQNMPLGEVYEGDLAYMLRSPGQFTSLDEIGNLVVLTRAGVPVYMRDIAIIRDGSEDVRSIIRVNGKPGVRLSINKQSGENTVEVSAALKREVERINREVQGVRLSVTNDTAVFIDRSIHAVREAVHPRLVPGHRHHLRLPAQLPLDRDHLHLDPDLDLRDVRAALLRRLHAEHDDVRRPGARRRHDRRRGDRRAREHRAAHAHGQAAAAGGDRGQRGDLVGDPGLDADPRRGVRAAVLPGRLLERAVPPALGGRDLLAADGAVRGGDDRAGAVRAGADAAGAGRPAQGHHRPPVHLERARPRRHGRGLPQAAARRPRPPADGRRASARCCSSPRSSCSRRCPTS